MTLADIHAAVPKHLYEKSTPKGLLYAGRDILCVFMVYQLGVLIEPFSAWLGHKSGMDNFAVIAKWALWALYWYWQSLAFAACWCFAHEAGHGNISPHAWVNDTVGFLMHSVWAFSSSYVLYV